MGLWATLGKIGLHGLGSALNCVELCITSSAMLTFLSFRALSELDLNGDEPTYLAVFNIYHAVVVVIVVFVF